MVELIALFSLVGVFICKLTFVLLQLTHTRFLSLGKMIVDKVYLKWKFYNTIQFITFPI